MRDTLLWDNDGILLDTEQLFFETTRSAFRELGLELTQEVWVRDYLGLGLGTTSIALKLGLSKADTEVFMERRNAAFYRLLETPQVPCPEVESVLAECKGRFTLAMVTGSPRASVEIMHKHSGLLHYFDLILTKEDYCESKPSPDAYLTAMKRLKVVPEQCLALEDSQRGVAAAVAAGLRCIAIPTQLTQTQDFSKAFAVERTVRGLWSHL